MTIENWQRFEYGGINNSTVGPTLASAATIAPTFGIHHVSGSAAISAVTPPWTGFSGTIVLIPDGTWSLATGGASGSAILSNLTATVNTPVYLNYDPSASSGAGAWSVQASGAVGSLNYLDVNCGAGASWASTNQGVGTVNVNAMFLPTQLACSAVDIFLSNTYSATNAGSSNAMTLSATFGVWTNNASTLSLFTSGSASTAFTVTGSSSSNSYNGIKAFQIPMAATLPAGNYWYGFIFSQASAGDAIAAAFTNVAASYAGAQSLYKGQLGSSSAGPVGARLGEGVFSASSTALNASMAISAVLGSAAANTCQYPVRFKGFSA